MPIYCIAALAVILITAFAAFYVLSKKKLATKENVTNLVICTVLAMVCTTLTPLWASLMAKGLYFSVFLSVVLSFILSAGITLAAYLPIHKYLYIRSLAAAASAEVTIPDSLKAEDAEPIKMEAPVSSDIPALESAAMINEAAIMHQVEEFKQTDEIKRVEENRVIEEKSTEIDSSDDKMLQLEQDKLDLNIAPESFDMAELIDRALEFKQNHNLPMAISYYEKAILLGPDEELLFWIVADFCALCKRAGQKELAVRILQSDLCALLKNEIKQDILQNL